MLCRCDLAILIKLHEVCCSFYARLWSVLFQKAPQQCLSLLAAAVEQSFTKKCAVSAQLWCNWNCLPNWQGGCNLCVRSKEWWGFHLQFCPPWLYIYWNASQEQYINLSENDRKGLKCDLRFHYPLPQEVHIMEDYYITDPNAILLHLLNTQSEARGIVFSLNGWINGALLKYRRFPRWGYPSHVHACWSNSANCLTCWQEFLIQAWNRQWANKR